MDRGWRAQSLPSPAGPRRARLQYSCPRRGGAGPVELGLPTAFAAEISRKFDTTTFVGAGHAIRRAAWQAVGGYDPSLFFTWEEYDFCLAAIARQWRIAYDGSLAVRHTPAAAARIGWDGTRMTAYVRNRLLISRKWGSSWCALIPRIFAYALHGSVKWLPAGDAAGHRRSLAHGHSPRTTDAENNAGLYPRARNPASRFMARPAAVGSAE